MKRNHRLAGIAMAVAGAFALGAFGAQAETPQEAKNKQVVIDYFAGLDHLETVKDKAQYDKDLRATLAKCCRSDYIQHNAEMAAYGQGTAGLIKMFENQRDRPPPFGPEAAPGPSKVITVMASGDMVVRINSREPAGGGEPMLIFNLFRMQDGKIAEHWDGRNGSAMGAGAPPPPPPR
jgi:predicted SnoaL-like aldol condensation-catalyzing enzyme